ncbi:MAG: cobalamin biosynthesis protein [Rhodobacterales bacterium]|nr:cobalamin biosynthesis protein [Rhodobacterales bacterium]
MIVAGFGFRGGATLSALQDALAQAGGPAGVTHLATLKTKAAGLEPLARLLDLPLVALDPAALRGIPTPTQSARVQGQFGTGSVAEAVALAAAGQGARLWGPRAVSADRMATAAIAEAAG